MMTSLRAYTPYLISAAIGLVALLLHFQRRRIKALEAQAETTAAQADTAVASAEAKHAQEELNDKVETYRSLKRRYADLLKRIGMGG